MSCAGEGGNGGLGQKGERECFFSFLFLNSIFKSKFKYDPNQIQISFQDENFWEVSKTELLQTFENSFIFQFSFSFLFFSEPFSNLFSKAI